MDLSNNRLSALTDKKSLEVAFKKIEMELFPEISISKESNIATKPPDLAIKNIDKFSYFFFREYYFFEQRTFSPPFNDFGFITPQNNYSNIISSYQKEFGKESIRVSPLLDLGKLMPPTEHTVRPDKYLFGHVGEQTFASNPYYVFNGMLASCMNLKEYLIANAMSKKFTGKFFDRKTVTYLSDRDQHGNMLIAYTPKNYSKQPYVYITTDLRRKQLLDYLEEEYFPWENSGLRLIQF